MAKNIKNTKNTALRTVCVCWALFIGIGALAGSYAMFIDPTGKVLGMDGFMGYFEVLPFSKQLFSNLIFPGISLLIVNGLTQLVTAVLLVKNQRIASRCFYGCGVILMMWIMIQFVIFPINVMSCLYFVFGLIEAICGLILYNKEN